MGKQEKILYYTIVMEINQTEKILKALANRRRLKIVKYLYQNKKATVTELAGHLKLSFKSTSKHLGVLRGANIIDSEQISLAKYYYLTTPTALFVKNILLAII